MNEFEVKALYQLTKLNESLRLIKISLWWIMIGVATMSAWH